MLFCRAFLLASTFIFMALMNDYDPTFRHNDASFLYFVMQNTFPWVLFMAIQMQDQKLRWVWLATNILWFSYNQFEAKNFHESSREIIDWKVFFFLWFVCDEKFYVLGKSESCQSDNAEIYLDPESWRKELRENFSSKRIFF